MNHRKPEACLALSLSTLLLLGLACGGSEAPAVPNTSTASNGGPNAAPVSPGAKRDIAGTYETTGTNVDGGGSYASELIVTPRDEVYQFSWRSGSNSYDGVGVVTDNTVAVSYTDGPDGKGCGVVLYKIGADGSLDGKAGYWGVNSAESEEGTHKSGSDLEGSYDIAGKNVEAQEYKGTLQIKKDGEGYLFTWNAGRVLSGFGIRQGDKAIAGFGGKQCAFVAYEIEPDGTLNGKWGGHGTKSFGTEIARRK